MLTVWFILMLAGVFGCAVGYVLGYSHGPRTAAKKLGRGFPVDPPGDRVP